MAGKPTVVFVDDQTNILQGFRRTLRGLEEAWSIHYLLGGKEALRLMETTPVDIIIADTNMPGMRGTELLHEVQSLHPETIRLVLSGGGSRSDDISVLLRTSHQFFSKPFDIDKLRTTVDRLLGLRDKVGDETLRKTIAGVSKLPCSPRLYTAFRKERDATSADLNKMGNYIAQDPGLTAKMLQSLNSTFFGVNKAGIHPFKAAQSMGPGTINYLFDEGTHFHTLDRGHPNYERLAVLYRRALHQALLTEALAQSEGLPETQINIAYTAGMLADIGDIIAAYFLPGVELSPALRAAGGAYFLGLWGFPDLAPALVPLVQVAKALAADQSPDGVLPADKLAKWREIDASVRTHDELKNWAFD